MSEIPAERDPAAQNLVERALAESGVAEPGPVERTAEGSGKGGIELSSAALTAIGSGALLLIFIVQNREMVTFEFLFWDFEWRLWFLVLLSATLGALIWLGLGILRRRRRRQARRAARRGEVPHA